MLNKIIAYRDSCLGLPPEILLMILGQDSLSSADLLNAKDVCRLWKDLCKALVIVNLNFGVLPKLNEDSFSGMFQCFSESFRGVVSVSGMAKLMTVTDDVVRSLGANLNGLETLNLKGCSNISADVLGQLGRLFPNLKHIDLSGCAVTDDVLRALGTSLNGLETLKIKDCSNISIGVLGQLGLLFPNLKHIDLSGCAVTGDVLSVLGANLKGLKTLKIKDCSNISTDVLVQLGLLFPKLKYIDLSGCAVTDDVLRALGANLKGLETLKIKDCSNISTDVLEGLCGLFPKLRYLDVPYKDDSIIQKIIILFPGVTINHSKYTDYRAKFFPKYPSLSELDLSSLDFIDSSFMNRIANAHPDICSLNLSGCYVSNDVIKECVFPRLLYLNLKGNVFLTDDSLSHIFSTMLELDSINLSGLNLLNLGNIDNGLKKLRYLDLSNCSAITPDNLCSFLEKATGLDSLYLNGVPFDSSEMERVIGLIKRKSIPIARLSLGADTVEVTGKTVKSLNDLEKLAYVFICNLNQHAMKPMSALCEAIPDLIIEVSYEYNHGRTDRPSKGKGRKGRGGKKHADIPQNLPPKNIFVNLHSSSPSRKFKYYSSSRLPSDQRTVKRS